jgi:hypothetical protein
MSFSSASRPPVVDEFVARIVADKCINGFLARAGNTAAAFQVLVEDPVGALDKSKVAPESEQTLREAVA